MANRWRLPYYNDTQRLALVAAVLLAWNDGKVTEVDAFSAIWDVAIKRLKKRTHTLALRFGVEPSEAPDHG